ncbi:RND family efflux transporter MFP subunit [Galbibacter marinus]|uniref:RND family efflux transporter MFP subunit n=1 Tax=Galbibacter marinus TaxID=555500 RepID=K2PSM9_9FLAO|nr:efflux RND transporter periplasmic adaptor subunit [Galbibacter marinus]EKF54569.1 RND family efflux transporter MFP subunit [Galbibacter marinus]
MKLKSKTQKVGIYAAIGVVVVLLVLAFIPNGVSAQEEGQQAATPVLEVETSLPLYESITEWDQYTGRFEASNHVDVRARVSGFLEKVNFTDGQLVKKGQVLFVIDQRPYRIALDQAKANYAQTLTTVKIAEDNYSRVESLRATGAVSIEEYDQRKQALAHAKASLQLAEAKVDQAQLDLEFTKVKAPISGLVSRDRVNQGNLIDGGSANSTLLTTIVATSPIHFYFTASESSYLKYVRLANNGKRTDPRKKGIPVEIQLLDEEDFVHKGKLDFIDNQIDMQSGTIESRAVLENEDQLLEPGMFGKARVIGSAMHDAIMIPDHIIGTNQSVRFVYVLNDSSEVVSKAVELGPLHSNGLRIVREGLSKDDKLITNNLQKIRPGMLVHTSETNVVKGESELASLEHSQNL